MPRSSSFTADAVRALPDDGNRYETVHGELLVTPAPSGSHQLILTRLTQILLRYLADNGLEDLLIPPMDISFDERTLLQPDLLVADLTSFRRSRKWADIRRLYLVIEVVSPSSATSDRVTKRRVYQKQWVSEYWIVDADQRQVEVWTPDAQFPVIEGEHLTWRHPALAENCAVDLVRLFSLE